MKAAIVIDKWKLSIFAKHLRKAGYEFGKEPGLTPNMLILVVETNDQHALHEVVKAANHEAKQRGRYQ